MKKTVMAAALCVCVAAVSFAQVLRGGTLYAAAKSVPVKSSTGFFARTQGTLSYGEQVTVLQVRGKWAQVRSVSRSSVSGWTASANLTAKRISVSGNTNMATASEIGLAGKGFNQEVENAYKAQGALNFADVDRTEAVVVAERDLEQFLIDGRLSMGDN